MPGLVLTIVICQTAPSVYGAVLCVVEAGLTAALAELCAEQTLAAPATAAITIAALNVFANFIVSCPSCLLVIAKPSGMGGPRDFFPRKNSLRLTRGSGYRPGDRVKRCLSEDPAPRTCYARLKMR